MTARPRTIGDRVVRDAETSFIGRDRELSELQAAIDAPELPFVVAFLHGPGGIGKTSLVQAVCRLTRRGVRAVILDCRNIEPTPHGFLATLAAAFGSPHGDVTLDTVVALVSAAARRTVLALDTYETFGLMDAWIRQVFVPALPDNVLTVIAGREAPDAAWATTPGWQDLFREIEICELPEPAVNQLLESRGLGMVQKDRARRFARGHPLALELAAAALRTRPDLDFTDTAPARVLQQLTSAFLAGLPPETTTTVEAASTVRRVTEPLLAALLKTDSAGASFSRLRELAFVTATNEGFILHDVVRDTIAAELSQRAPERRHAYRQRAWEFFKAESRNAIARHLWQTTADMLYLIENPTVRQAFFPEGGRDYPVEPAVPGDGHSILEISASFEPPVAADWIARWWRYHPEMFSVVRGRGLNVVGFFLSFDPTMVTAEILAQDPLTAAWLSDLQAHPLAVGERVVFLRRWLAIKTGEAPSPIQAACWLDIKRSYMELRPSLRRLYTTLTDPAKYAQIAPPLGFRPIQAANVALGGQTYYAHVLDFGPGSVDGWIASLVGAELGIGPTGPQSLPFGDRHLTTVLFTDIVESTERAMTLGDAQWRVLLERHHTLIRTLLARHQGREINTTGDGFFATFDTPARAIRCALAITAAIGQLRLTLRAGIHTGECETMGDDIAGIAVHVGARVCSRADAGEVLVTNTVKELVTGTDLFFEDRGHHSLKGLPGDWLLFAAKSTPG